MKFNTLAERLSIAAACAAVAVSAGTFALAQQDKPKPQQPTPEQALEKLMDGNARYVKGEARQGDITPAQREKLAAGQSPYAVIVGCADSRVPPELAFDGGPGDLFVIRDAGNIVDDNEIASIEYAVAVLNVPLVVVLGHESCGAVDAAVKAQTKGASFDGHIHDLVEDLRPSVIAAMRNKTEGEGDTADKKLLDAAVRENVRRVVDELERSKPYVGPAAEEGKIMIVPARYDLDTGEVTVIDMKKGGEAHEGHDHAEHDHGQKAN